MKALTVGSATVDIITTIADDDIERMTLQNSDTAFLLMQPGRKVDARSITTHTGGGAVNTAVSFKRLGFESAALVKLGKDHNAEKVMARLDEVGIEKFAVSICPTEATAVSVMIAAHDKNAAIFTHRGANGFLTEADIGNDKFDCRDLVYITNLSNQSAELFPAICERAKTAGAFVSANPGVLQLTQRTDSLFDSMQHIDFFSCNFEEARALVPALVDRTGWERQTAPHPDVDDRLLAIEGFRVSLDDYFRRMHSLGPTHIGVTDGVNGSFLSVNGKTHFTPAIPVEVEATAGAGDAFASTLTACLVLGLDVDQAMLLAAHNAASVVGQVDAQGGLLDMNALQARIQ